MALDQAHNLTDRSFIILRKRNFLELTFQEFRGQYATTFNVMNPPERAKLMKLPIIKVSYSQKHKKQTMRVLIEKDYLCDHGKQCIDNNCHKLHCLKESDRCHLFDRDQTCNNPKCTKLHIPSKSLHSRILEVFKKSSRSIMPFSKFIVLHRTTYPYLREHHPTNDILTTEEFRDIVRIENTEKTKEIRLLRRRRSGDKYSGIERPPSLSENIDAPYPALKIISFDNKWIDTENLLHDIKNLFSMNRVKDIFIPGHMRMAFVTFTNSYDSQNAVKKLNDTWFCGRKVTVSLSERRMSVNDNDEEKVPSSSSRICIKAINNVISEQRIKEWLDRIGKIEKIETCFVQCRKGSDIAYIHFKSMKIIHEILNKEKKNNYLVTFRGKQIKLSLCDDGYTDSSAYYSLKTKQSKMNNDSNGSSKNHDEQKQKHHHHLQNQNHFRSSALKSKQSRSKSPNLNPNNIAPSFQVSKSMPDKYALVNNNNNDRNNANSIQSKEDKKNDSMHLLLMRLKSLIENTIETQKSLESKLKVLSMINNKQQIQNKNNKHKNDSNDDNDEKKSEDINGKNNNGKHIDIDIIFGDESYTIDAMKESLETLKNDKNQIQVYKQALTAFETSQSRAMNKNQRELKPISDKEIRLAKSLQSVSNEIEMLQKQLLLKRNEQEVIKQDLDITRIKAKTLRNTITEMKKKLEPIRDCLAAFDPNKKSKHKHGGRGRHRRSSSSQYKRNINIKADEIPTDDQINEIEKDLLIQEENIAHWLKWDKWNLQDATSWIGSLENGKFKEHLSKFNALSKISQGSILNAITDPTLQIIGISDAKDREIIINSIAMLKSRTAMMKKSERKFRGPKFRKSQSESIYGGKRRSSVSSPSLMKGIKADSVHDKAKKYGLDELAMHEMIKSKSIQSDVSDANLCVICMDRSIAPYAMVPCGHQCLCSICKNLIKPNKHKCPMCNGDVTMIIKLFRA